VSSKVTSWLRWLQRTPAVVAVISLAMTGGLLYYFSTTHPADRVNLSAQHISRIVVTGTATADMTGYARRIRLRGATGQVDVVLPVPATACQQLAGELNVQCDGTGITLGPSFVAEWTAAQGFNLPSLAGDRIDLSTVPSAGGGGMQLTVTNGQIPLLCFVQGDGAAKLTLTAGSASVTLAPAAVAVHLATCSGLHIRVQSGNPVGTAVLVLQDLSDTTGHLGGKQMTVSAQSETLTLVSISQDSPYNGPIEIDSDSPFQMAVQGVPPDMTAPDGLQVPRAVHIEQAHAERLANGLVRNPLTSLLESGIPIIVGFVLWLLPWMLPKLFRPHPAPPPHGPGGGRRP